MVIYGSVRLNMEAQVNDPILNPIGSNQPKKSYGVSGRGTIMGSNRRVLLSYLSAN